MPLLVCLLAVFVVVATLWGLGVRALALGARQGERSTRASATWLTAPCVAAVSVCAALVFPGVFFASCHCLGHGLHHPHLCVHHADYAAVLLWPAAVVTAAWMFAALPKLASLAGSWWQTRRWVRRMLNVPVQMLDGVTFRLVDAAGLGACTAGLFRPIIIVDAGLWRTLGEEERRAVLHHEEAHRVRRDPLSMFVLRGSAIAAVLVLAPAMLRHWHTKAELECDRYAAERVGSPETIASALLALERYHRVQPQSPVSLGLAAGSSTLEVRVRALLAIDGPLARANLVSDALAVALTGTAVLALCCACAEVVHHGAETLLGLLVHHA